jgi:hypothetical protein
VIQAHLLRPSAKQSPETFSSSFPTLSFLVEETDPLRLTTFLQLEEDATLKGDDSHEDEASEEYEAVIEALFFLKIEEQRDEHCFRVVLGEAGVVGFFAFSSFESMMVFSIIGFSSFIPGGFLCSLFPVGPRTDRNSRSSEFTDRNLGGTDIDPILTKNCFLISQIYHWITQQQQNCYFQQSRNLFQEIIYRKA